MKLLLVNDVQLSHSATVDRQIDPLINYTDYSAPGEKHIHTKAALYPQKPLGYSLSGWLEQGGSAKPGQPIANRPTTNYINCERKGNDGYITASIILLIEIILFNF